MGVRGGVASPPLWAESLAPPQPAMSLGQLENPQETSYLEGMDLAQRRSGQLTPENLFAWLLASGSSFGLGCAQSSGEGSLRVLSQRETLGAGGLLRGGGHTSLYLHTHPWARPPSPLTWTSAVAFPMHLMVPILSRICFQYNHVSCYILPSSLCFCLSLNQPQGLCTCLTFYLGCSSRFTWVLPTHPSGVSSLPLLREPSLGALTGFRPLFQALTGAPLHSPDLFPAHLRGCDYVCVGVRIWLGTVSPTGLSSTGTAVCLLLLTVVSRCLPWRWAQNECSVNIFYFCLINLFVYFWLHWVFVAAHGLSLVAASGGFSSLRCAGFSLWWLLLLWSTGSRRTGLVAPRHVGSSQTGIEPMCSALAGRFLTTAPPEKSCKYILNECMMG